MSPENKTLVLAIDAFKSENSLKSAISSTAKIAEKADWRMKIVSVMSPDQIEWPDDFTTDWLEVFRKVGTAALTKLLKKNRAQQPIESKILFQLHNSRKGSIQAILTEIESMKASAVAVFTHIRRSGGVKLPAGFVSSIVSGAGIPVLVVSAKAPTTKKLDKLVFATDFSEADQASFEQALKFTSNVKASMVIIHVLPNLVNEVMAAYAGIAGGWNNYGTFLDLQYEKAEADGKAWKEKAEAAGIEAKFEMLSNSRSIPGAILRSAKKHRADLIVMTEKTGPWAATLLGSVTRKIIETSPLPVIVFPTSSIK